MDWLYYPRALKVGKLDVQIGGMGVKRFGLMLPDGLHVWWGSRGVHLYWHRSEFQPGHVIFDRETAK